MQSFDRNTPLPEKRLELLFDSARRPKQVTFEEMSPETPGLQLQRRLQRRARRASTPADAEPARRVDATRAGMGCGSCKTQVRKSSSACG